MACLFSNFALFTRNNLYFHVKYFSKELPGGIMKYLNVAEKNDAAKNIAFFLSRGGSTKREGLSKYNKIYEFTTQVLGEQANMVMTSVSGHLLNYAFTGHFKNWQSCNPIDLFDAPVIKCCPSDFENIKKTLEREIVSCQGLIIWTDCDREGENIGFEIIKVCTDIKPHLRIYRAKFSEITAPSVFRALNTLGQANKNVSDAVDVRQELDLRTGAAFTRLQTLRLQKVFPAKLSDKIISYGSCQFPTLGFVVERYQAIEDFISESFWRIKMNHTVGEITSEYTWGRDRLFNKLACEAILDICKENPTATVEHVDSREKSKWRPLPLDTVEMEKNVSRKLKINAKDTMRIAERLYTQGYISYPRTETNIFPKELNLQSLVEKQTNDQRWGPFAHRILNEGGPNPRQGKKSDQAHPPIHPTKYANDLTGNEQRLYEYIVRHFLACLHKDAKGFETTVIVNIAGERFTTKGLIILEKNYLDVYIYEKWNAKEINSYQVGDTFIPSVLDIVESTTSPPKLLTEADLITLMEKHGIGTDATHAEHIDKIKSREYVGLHENIYFVPGTLGMGLVEGYNTMNLEVSLAKPLLRAQFENDLKLICDGLKDPEIVKREQIESYRAVFQKVFDNMRLMDESLANRLDDRPEAVQNNQIVNQQDHKPVLKCPKCGSDMVLRDKKNGPGKMLTCINYPNCKNTAWFPINAIGIKVMDIHCSTCGPQCKKLEIKFKQNLFPGEPNPNILCIGGCDRNVLQTLDIDFSIVNQSNIGQGSNLSGNNNCNTSSFNMRTGITTTSNTSDNNSSRQNSRNNTNSKNSNTSLLPKPNTSTLNHQFNNIRNTFGDVSGPSRNQSDNSFRTSRNPGNSFGDDNQADTEIVCSCNNKAILLTVKKDGPNKGRQFYKCASSICQFFLWASTTDSNNSTQPANSTVPSRQNDVEVQCRCNQPAVKRVVSKTGPNTGREFYCCSKNKDSGSCGFFKWVDENDDTNNQGNNWNTTTTSKPQKGNKTNRNKPYEKKTKAASKCGICRETGHTKRNCPHK